MDLTVKEEYLNYKTKLVVLSLFLFTPLFYIRLGGFDFTKGTSLSFGDYFISIAIILGIKYWLKNQILITVSMKRVLVWGSLFFIWSSLASIIGHYLYARHCSIVSSLISCCQYGFVMLGLPMVAMLLRNQLEEIIKLLALVYLIPLILVIVLSPEYTFEEIRHYLFFASRAIGTYGNANTFSSIILITMPYYIYLAYYYVGFWRFVGYAGQTLSFICLIETITFSSFFLLVCQLCLFAIYMIYLFLKERNLSFKKITKYAISSIAVLFLLTYFQYYIYAPNLLGYLQTRLVTQTINLPDPAHPSLKDTRDNGHIKKSQSALEQGIKYGSSNQRLKLILHASYLIRERNGSLFWGHGLKNTQFMPEFIFNFNGNVFGLDVHNTYILLWIEGGLVLSLLFIGYFYNLIRGILTQAKNENCLFPILFSIISFMLVGLFYPHLYMRFFWLPLLPAYIVLVRNKINQ